MADTKISALTAATTPLAGTEVLPIVQSGVTKQVSVADLTAGRAVSALSLSLTNALTAANGGTGLTSFTANGVVYASSTSALTTGSALTFDGTILNASTGTPLIRATASTTNALYGFELNGGGLDAYFKAQPNSAELRIGSGRSAGWGGFTTFYVDTVEQVRIANTGNVTLQTGNIVQGTAAKGINFTANTGAAGKTSQLLNWYEEGTWTPAVSGASGTTYTTQNGWYTRVGNLVTVGFELTINAAGTITGGAAISGLPFTSAATYKSSGSLSYAGTVVTSTVWQGLTIGASQSVLTIYIKTAAGTSTTSINGSDFFGAGTQIIGLMTYRV